MIIFSTLTASCSSQVCARHLCLLLPFNHLINKTRYVCFKCHINTILDSSCAETQTVLKRVLFTRKNGYFSTIFVTEQSCQPLQSLNWSVLYIGWVSVPHIGEAWTDIRTMNEAHLDGRIFEATYMTLWYLTLIHTVTLTPPVLWLFVHFWFVCLFVCFFGVCVIIFCIN